MGQSLGIEIVDVEWKIGRDRLLRVFLDRPTSLEHPQGGISHEDCETVSQQLSAILDVEDLVPGPSYILEVSSPGLDRKLMKPEDYTRFAGRKAKIWLNEPVENSKYYEGRLAGFADGRVQLELKNRVITLPFAEIRKANLVVEF